MDSTIVSVVSCRWENSQSLTCFLKLSKSVFGYLRRKMFFCPLSRGRGGGLKVLVDFFCGIPNKKKRFSKEGRRVLNSIIHFAESGTV